MPRPDEKPRSSSLLELRGIGKSFGRTHALRGVDLAVGRGEVHALIGENGAGKSTLMKILSGALRADAGSIAIDGSPCRIDSPADGRRLGIAMIYQELNLAPHLTVEENLTLGAERSCLGFIRRDPTPLREALERLGHADLPLSAPVRSLPIGLQQVVEIARALVARARVVIMDEPTSSLGESDAEALFRTVGLLRDSGISVIYISHFLEEVFEIADRYTVLRDGEVVGTGDLADVTQARIIEMMVGRKVDEMFPRRDHAMGEEILRAEGLSGDPAPEGVSFSLRRGEILGVAGLVGSGRSETVRSLFGLQAGRRGNATIGERSVRVEAVHPGRALALGEDLLSEDRKEEGLATEMTIAENTTLSSLGRFARPRGWGMLRLGREKRAASGWIEKLAIRCRGPEQAVSGLSGGNQQKVALARILERRSDIVFLDEPTRGVDVGSKVEIYRLVGELAASGKAVVFVSSYLPELFGVCDTLAVMHRGRMSEKRPAKDWTPEAVMRFATSGAA